MPSTTAANAQQQSASASPPAEDVTNFGTSAQDLAEIDRLLNLDVQVASKVMQSLLEAPSSVTVFTEEDIRNLGITSLEELLNFVPGFTATRDVEQGMDWRFGVRGRSKNMSEFVLVLVDGQRLNDVYTGGAILLNRYIPVENIHQVEIIRGPGSALYGSNAFMGVVSIVTKQKSNDATLRYGEFGSLVGAANLSSELHGVEVDAFVKGFSDQGYTFRNQPDIFGRISDVRDPNRGFDATARVRYKGLELSARHLERASEDGQTFGVNQDNSAHELTRQTMISARYELDVTEKLWLSLNARFNRDTWDAIAELAPAGTQVAPDYALSEAWIGGPSLRSYGAGIYADARLHLLEQNALSGGASFELAGIDAVANVMTHDPVTLEYKGRFVRFEGEWSFNETEQRRIFGAYVEDQHKIGDWLTLTGGVRLDAYSDFGTSVNPRAAAVAKLPWNAQVKVLYGRAFRAPSFLEFYDKMNPVDFGNLSLKPEDIHTFELAYTQRFDPVSVTVTAFRNILTHQIDYGDPVADVRNPLNAPTFFNRTDKQVTDGLEAELTAAVGKNLLVRANYTRLFEPEITPLMPAGFGSLIATYKAGPLVFNGSLLVREKYVSLPEQNPYAIVNAAVTWNITDQFAVQGTVRNIGDYVYKSPSVLLEGGAPNRGRLAQIGLLFRQ